MGVCVYTCVCVRINVAVAPSRTMNEATSLMTAIFSLLSEGCFFPSCCSCLFSLFLSTNRLISLVLSRWNRFIPHLSFYERRVETVQTVC